MNGVVDKEHIFHENSRWTKTNLFIDINEAESLCELWKGNVKMTDLWERQENDRLEE